MHRSVKADFFSRLTMEKVDFKTSRKINKYGSSAAFFVLFKTAVGIGLFSFPYAYQRAGVIYAGFLSLLVGYMTGYGGYCLAVVANKVEKKKLGLLHIDGYHGNKKSNQSSNPSSRRRYIWFRSCFLFKMVNKCSMSCN